MASVLLAALLALAAVPGDGTGEGDGAVGFTQLSIRVEGELLDVRFVDMDGDGRRDLVTAVLARRPGLAARREIHIHAMAADGTVPLEPTRVVAVPDDVIVYGFADVRDDPGRELLLMTRSGIRSLSPQIEGLRDNLRRVASCDLLYQVPSSRSLASWSYVLEQPGQHDLLVVPGAAGLSVWGPVARSGGAITARPAGTTAAAPAAADAGSADGSTDGSTDAATAAATTAATTSAQPDDYSRLVDLGGAPDSLFSVKSPGAVKAAAGGLKVSIDSGRNRGLFLEDAPSAYSALLQAEMRTDAPALADVDGDGRKDILFFDDKTLRVYLASSSGFSATPSRTETLPAWLDPGEGDLILNLHDLDRDGDIDAYARVAPEQDSLDRVAFSYFVMLNDGQRLFPEQPQQVLRFEGAGTDSEITDVNADGKPDLVVTKYELPAPGDLLAGAFRLTRSAFVYFAGDGDEPFARKPDLRDEQLFTIDSLQDALVNRRISGDLSGDGIADLMEVDLTGHVVIRRITYEDAFFGGGEWLVEEAPWKRMDLGANLAELQLEDVNGDGLADLINPGEDVLALVLSRRTGGGQ